MQISIASGKGGTGKTTLSLLLATAHPDITLVDCDVEEPNCHLFLQPKSQNNVCDIAVEIPYINSEMCSGCGACANVCLFNALAIVGGKALLFDELCHSCGSCMIACRQQAISERKKIIGTLVSEKSNKYPNIHLLSGLLKVGTPSAVPLIKKIKQEANKIKGDILIDCPPGTSCAMVTAIQESDFCILVTEPTLFGRHDLELAINITRLLSLPTGVVINKSDGGAGDDIIENLCKNHHTPIIGKIPHNLSFAKKYASGQIPTEFLDIAQTIWRKVRVEGGAMK